MASDGNNSGISSTDQNRAILDNSGSVYNKPDSDCEMDVQKHWFFELGKNEDFTVCDDDDVIARIDPPVFVSSEKVVAETDCDRPHTKKDDSNSSISGVRQVDAADLCKLKSLEWMTDILMLKTENSSHCTTMVGLIYESLFSTNKLFSFNI